MKEEKFNDTKTIEIDGEEHEITTLSTLTKSETNRGFGIYEFYDMYGSPCSLQDSSLATEAAIWFGLAHTEPIMMASDTPEGGTGWVEVPIPDEAHIPSRMHLTQEQVKALLPILIHFAETGEYIRDFEEAG